MTTITAQAKQKPMRGRRFRETFTAYAFISPWIAGFLLFMGGPIVASFVLSFFRWKMISAPKFIGLLNYVNMFTTDQLFRISIGVTFKFLLISVPLSQALAIFLAVLLNQKVRLTGYWRTAFYLPAIVSGVAGAVLWRWMYHQQFGVFNNLLEMLGVVGPNWLISKAWVMWALVIKSLWNVGVPMVIYLAALQAMPKQLYEAAEIDGAGEGAKFFNITLPMLTPVIFFNVVMGIISGIQTFTEPYVMTGGGPDNTTLFLGLHLYQSAFSYLKMGYASAMAWIMFLIIFVLTIIQFRLGRLWVYYETGEG